MNARTDEAGDAETSFEPKTIRSRLPSGLSPIQERALIAAARNPDATINQIAAKSGVERRRVLHALDSLACGVAGAASGHGSYIDRRGGEKRAAEAYSELTDKQQVVVDFLARTPAFDVDERSTRELYEAVKAHAGDDMPDMHYTYPVTVVDRYADLVPARRQELRVEGELDAADYAVDVDVDVAVPSLNEPVRGLLERAGVPLPDSNLDDMSDIDIPDDLPEPPETDTTATVEVDLDEVDVTERTKLHNYVGDDAFDDDDVEVGGAYRGVVNGLVEWGVWVTIGGDPDSPGDVSGVMPVEKLRKVDRGVDDYAVGDHVKVVAAGRNKLADGKVRHRFVPAELALAGGGDEEPESDADETAVALAEQVENLTSALADTAERIGDVEERVGRLAEQVEENTEATPTPEQAAELNDAASTVLEANDRLDDVEGTLDALGDRVETVENRTRGHTESLDDVRGMIDDLGERVGDMASEVAPLDHVENLDLRIDTLEHRLDARAELIDEREQAVARVDDVADRLDAVEQRLDESGGEGREMDMADVLRFAVESDEFDVDVDLQMK